MTDATPFEILPAIDLRDGRVVRLRQGDFSRETAYGLDPVEVARTFAEAGARWLHVVDLDGAREGRPVHGALIGDILAAIGDGTRVEVAGGLRSAGAVAGVLASGAARAVIGTAALADPALVGALVARHGANAVAVAIDVRGGRAIGHGWSKGAPGVEAERAIGELADAGVRWFEVTAIERDGVLEGPDLALYERLARLVEPGRGHIIASGGIATLDDLRAVRELGTSGAIIGRALYERQLTLEDALAERRE
jgi:phosphoribosylformimino-5-aminoimidazole carboxamide ribotide isomerase